MLSHEYYVEGTNQNKIEQNNAFEEKDIFHMDRHTILMSSFFALWNGKEIFCMILDWYISSTGYMWNSKITEINNEIIPNSIL